MTAADVSLLGCFSSPPLSPPDRSGQVTLMRGERLRCCQAIAEILFRLRVKQDVSCIPAGRDSQSAPVAVFCSIWRRREVCSQLRPFRKGIPRAVHLETNPGCRNVRVTWFLLSRKAHLTFSVISPFLLMLPFAKLFPHLCRCTNTPTHTSSNARKQMCWRQKSWGK